MKPSWDFFFGGVDPAPSEKQSSDDGAIVIGRARPKREVGPGEEALVSAQPSDWWFDYIYARRVTWKDKYTVRQWAGLLHDLHHRFRFTRLVIDPQSGGGGRLIGRELAEPRQLIGGIEVEVIPITTPLQIGVARAQHILHYCERSDPGVMAVWPEMKDAAGDDVLNDALYSTMRDALERVAVCFPAPWDDWWAERREEARRLPEEAQWTLKNFQAAIQQFSKVAVATNADGTHALTRRNARRFEATGKKDLVSACMYAYLGFLMWMRSGWQRQRRAGPGRVALRSFA